MENGVHVERSWSRTWIEAFVFEVNLCSVVERKVKIFRDVEPGWWDWFLSDAADQIGQLD